MRIFYNVLLVVLLVGALAACQPAPLAPSQMLPSEAVYGQINQDGFLKGKIMVDDVTYAGERELLAPLYSEAGMSLAMVLNQSGYIAADEKAAQYRLSAVIRDTQIPRCFFGSCESGAAIDYTLVRIKDGKTVFSQLLVVPYTMEYPLFGADMGLVQRGALGGALGENYAHLLQVLSRKTKKEL